MSRFNQREQGFTLIELMVVIIIIGILVAIAIPSISKQSDKAKIKRTVAELKSMKTIVDIHIAETGTTPEANKPGIKTLLEKNGYQAWSDPWGRGYVYIRGSSSEYILYSKGPREESGDEIVATDKINPTENSNITSPGYDISTD